MGARKGRQGDSPRGSSTWMFRLLQSPHPSPAGLPVMLKNTPTGQEKSSSLAHYLVLHSPPAKNGSCRLKFLQKIKRRMLLCDT